MSDRQSIVTLAVRGRYTSKPRPWVILQNDDFRATDSVILCAFTHALIQGVGFLRIDVAPSAANGLRDPSQIQVEKIATVRRSDLGKQIGRLEDHYMRELERAVRTIMSL